MATEKEGQPNRQSEEFKQRVDVRAYFRAQRKAKKDISRQEEANWVEAESEELLKGEIVVEVQEQVGQDVTAANTAADRSEDVAIRAARDKKLTTRNVSRTQSFHDRTSNLFDATRTELKNKIAAAKGDPGPKGEKRIRFRNRAQEKKSFKII